MESPSTKEGEFGLGFNDIDFSDRVLRLEITSDSGDTDFEVKKLYVCSLILAAKSPYFYKLFKIDMKEAKQRDEVTLRKSTHLEAAFVELLKLMYGIPMSASSAPELVDVLMAAEKYVVPYCGKLCIELLRKLPMTTKDAVFYLDLPSSALEYKEVETLYCTAQGYLAAHFRNLTRYKEEAMNLPLSALKFVLGIDGLQVHSEDYLFDFVLEWAHLHYPELEERREILINLIKDYLYLANISSLRFMELVDRAVFSSEQALKLLLSALKSKDDVLTGREYDFPGRVYGYKLIKVVHLQLAQPSCFVYFDLTKEDVVAAAADHLFSIPIFSETIYIGGQTFTLKWRALGLHIYRCLTADDETCTLDFEFEVMMKSSKDFQSLFRSNNSIFKGGQSKGCSDLFGVSCAHFMSDSCEYFVDGMLHFRVKLTIVD